MNDELQEPGGMGSQEIPLVRIGQLGTGMAIPTPEYHLLEAEARALGPAHVEALKAQVMRQLATLRATT